MNKRLNIKAIIERKYDLTRTEDLENAGQKYFIEPLHTKKNMPSKEDAAWFIEIAIKATGVRWLTNSVLGAGYLTVKDFLQLNIDLSAYDTSSCIRSITNGFSEHPLPTNKEEIKELLELIPTKKRDKVVRDLVGLYPSKIALSNYKEFVDNGIELLMTYGLGDTSMRDHIIENATYIPSKFIIAYLSGAVFSETEFCKLWDKFNYYLEDNACALVVDQMANEILPYMANHPLFFRGKRFPFGVSIKVSDIVDSMASHVTSMKEVNSETKVRLYNMFVKPLLSGAARVRDLYPRATEYDLKRFIQIVSIVTPASECLDILNIILESATGLNNYATRRLISEFGERREKNRLEVTKEFIKFQLSRNVYEGALCLNNPEISNLKFWLELKDQGLVTMLPCNEMVYNNSFRRNFVPKVEELDLYKENSDFIKWSSVSAAKVLPIEFLKEFKSELIMHYFSKKTLAELDEEIVSFYIENERDIPVTILDHNKKLSPGFIIDIMDNIFHDEYLIRDKHGKDIKLADLVGALA